MRRVGFVATVGGTVEDWVIPHQELQPTGRGGVNVVDGTLVEDESAEARALRQVADNVRSGGARKVIYDWRHPGLDHRLDPLAGLFVGA